MIINSFEAKSEALLFFCNEIIEQYKDDMVKFNLDKELLNFINDEMKNIQYGIKVIIQDKDYYIKNQNIFRIKYIVKSILFLENKISTLLELNQPFNPTQLVVSLLTVWFREFEILKGNKIYIFFWLYPYSLFFDKVFSCKDNNFKNISLKMIDISEKLLIDFKNLK